VLVGSGGGLVGGRAAPPPPPPITEITINTIMMGRWSLYIK
jgi:hypothetical protein